jgi:hypothetical protein
MTPTNQPPRSMARLPRPMGQQMAPPSSIPGPAAPAAVPGAGGTPPTAGGGSAMLAPNQNTLQTSYSPSNGGAMSPGAPTPAPAGGPQMASGNPGLPGVDSSPQFKSAQNPWGGAAGTMQGQPASQNGPRPSTPPSRFGPVNPSAPMPGARPSPSLARPPQRMTQ